MLFVVSSLFMITHVHVDDVTSVHRWPVLPRYIPKHSKRHYIAKPSEIVAPRTVRTFSRRSTNLPPGCCFPAASLPYITSDSEGGIKQSLHFMKVSKTLLLPRLLPVSSGAIAKQLGAIVRPLN